jgi:Flp pilus assembly protein TadD
MTMMLPTFNRRPNCKPLLFLLLLFVSSALVAQNNVASVIDQELYLKQADAALREGRVTQAKQMIAWLEQNGDRIASDDVALLKAEYAIAGMDLPGAKAAIASVREPTRNICRTASAKGWIAAHEAALEDAIVALGTAAQNCPRDAGVWNLLGLVFIQKGETAAAREAFGHALILAPNEPDILNNHALALLQNGELELASNQLEIAARNAPDNRMIRANLDFVSGMRGAVPNRQSEDSDAEWSVRLIDFAKGAKTASRSPQANALFSRALLILDQFDESIWTELTTSQEIQP